MSCVFCTLESQSLGGEYTGIWGFPKTRDPILGVPKGSYERNHVKEGRVWPEVEGKVRAGDAAARLPRIRAVLTRAPLAYTYLYMRVHIHICICR